MKFTCFIDTCSYVNLSHDDCYINGQTLLDLLNKEVTIRYSHEVNKEIARHYTPLMPADHKRHSKIYALKNRRKDYKKYEICLFDSASKSGEKNRGEKHNFVALMDSFLCDNKVGLIFLTDDTNALNGVLKDSVNSFPVFQVWNSYDAILFLYMKCKHFGKDFAEAAIRNISAELSRSTTPQTSHLKTNERIRIFKLYIDKLNKINKLITN